jgi:hypothetical protein
MATEADVLKEFDKIDRAGRRLAKLIGELYPGKIPGNIEDRMHETLLKFMRLHYTSHGATPTQYLAWLKNNLDTYFAETN